MHIKANGITFNYAVDGTDGAPWLVLSNSLATTLAMWDAQAAELKRAFRVLRYDQRGHGATDAPAGRYTFDLLIADALALIDALSISRAHFVGLSMGGATARSSAIPAARRPRPPASNGKSASRSRRRRAWRCWSSRPSRAGSRPRPCRPIRRISTRCGR